MRIRAFVVVPFLFILWLAHADDKRPRQDLYGDPLPEGAVARMGTVRLRHGNGIYAAALSPDGKMAASTGGHYTTNLWDVKSGRKIREFSPGPQSFANDAVAFSPNGEELAIGGNGVFIFDTRSGALIRNLSAGPVHSMAYSPDGAFLATGLDSAGAWLWETASGKKLFELKSKPAEQQRALVCGVSLLQGSSHPTASSSSAVARETDLSVSGMCKLDGKLAYSRNR
jgi:WD40 repeat protein